MGKRQATEPEAVAEPSATELALRQEAEAKRRLHHPPLGLGFNARVRLQALVQRGHSATELAFARILWMSAIGCTIALGDAYS